MFWQKSPVEEVKLLLGSEGNEKRGRLDCNCFTSSQLLCSKTQAVMQVRAPYVKHCLVGVELREKGIRRKGMHGVSSS